VKRKQPAPPGKRDLRTERRFRGKNEGNIVNIQRGKKKDWREEGKGRARKNWGGSVALQKGRGEVRRQKHRVLTSGTNYERAHEIRGQDRKIRWRRGKGG